MTGIRCLGVDKNQWEGFFQDTKDKKRVPGFGSAHALDEVGLAFDLYLLWLSSLRFGERDLQHPILVSCIHLVSFNF